MRPDAPRGPAEASRGVPEGVPRVFVSYKSGIYSGRVSMGTAYMEQRSNVGRSCGGSAKYFAELACFNVLLFVVVIVTAIGAAAPIEETTCVTA